MPGRFIETNNIKLHVVTDGPGDGTPVILLHGFPEFHYGWRKQIPVLAQAGFRVIAPDQRGYNLSDKPRRVSAYRVETLAKDILGLFDHFGIRKARLVGHDWGAVAAWDIALHHPDRLEKLAILNAPHPDVMARFMLENPEQRKKLWYVFFFQIPLLPEWILRKDNYRDLVRTIVGSGRKSTFSRQDIEEYKKAWSQPGALTAMLNWYRAIVRASFKSVLRFKREPARRVKSPVLILWGKNDAALSHELVQPSLELCDHGSAVLYEKATHWVHLDEADDVNNRLIGFLQ
ncbi:MAG: alpha/beta hydrolase [Anaerolineales bacterium]|nr:alpha/beta hydrolase [Anaerolineales bacterium]